jgi:H+-translocating NAD(P) transhydrogenase subunit alpha
MKIGILKEQKPEKRVVLMPDSVQALINLKVEFLIEKGAGTAAHVDDSVYEQTGAKIADRKKVLSESDILLQINPFSVEDIKAVDSSKVLIAMMEPFSNKEAVQELISKKLTAFSLELVPRISRAQSMDILSSMATVSGYRAVLDAAFRLPRFFPMFMSAAGTIKPAKLLILGAGVAGLQAIAIARKLGAIVEVFDVRSAVKEEVKSLGGKFVEVEGATEDAAAGGYAVEQTEEFKEKQAKLIHDHAVKSDVIICTAQIPGKKAPILIKKETVAQMRSGSVIIDLAASTGGNCEATKNNEVIETNGITIVGNSYYPNDMQIDASSMFGRNVTNLLKLFIDEEGKLKLDFEDEIIRGTCLTHQGGIINERVKSIL